MQCDATWNDPFHSGSFGKKCARSAVYHWGGYPNNPVDRHTCEVHTPKWARLKKNRIKEGAGGRKFID